MSKDRTKLNSPNSDLGDGFQDWLDSSGSQYPYNSVDRARTKKKDKFSKFRKYRGFDNIRDKDE